MRLDSFIKPFTSIRLTVALLVLGMVLVFWGTLAQVELGLFKAQNEFFRSFFIFWGPKSASWKIPIFPGGYFVGGVLLINLVTAHFKRFRFSREKVGIWMVHVGLILLLLGTDSQPWVGHHHGSSYPTNRSWRQAPIQIRIRCASISG